MRIFVRDSKGNSLSFEFNENDCIKVVRDQVKDKLMNQNECKLIFNGELLEDDGRISDYDIQSNNYIICVGEFLAGILFIYYPFLIILS